MKKQIYQFTVFIVSLALLSPLSLMFSTQKSYAAPARCYTTLGYLVVAPTTANCTVDQLGRIVYLDQNNVLLERPADDACYAGAPASGSGSFQSRTFNEQSCSDLEALRTARRQQLCDASGGTWSESALACTCPAGQELSSSTAQCGSSTPTNQSDCEAEGGTWRSVGTASGGVEYGQYCQLSTTGGGSGGDIDIRETRESDCRSPNNEDLTEENCGIIALLNTVFNLVSGAVSLAVIGNIIVAGIQYSSAQGDPGAAAKAKTRIRNALLAFLMYLSLYGFIQWLIPGGVF